MISRDDRARVVRGQVFYRNQWVPVEEKEAGESEFRKRLQQGYVLYQGEWMTIEDKLARVRTAQAPPQQAGQHHYYYNPTIAGQVYNVQDQSDRRTYQQSSDRHLHVDPGALPPGWANQQNLGAPHQGQAQLPPQQTPPAFQQPLRQIEDKLPREAPQYFYGDDESEVNPQPPEGGEGMDEQ
ncbi:MAG: hypothetical protein GF418_03300 [Chitinivibrionales bacterium]|nr:hypothetical protein [Chitinivibrionales bacterium]MBD3394629.1 hypothetical protein [Chitinivibrionales bacterium]